MTYTPWATVGDIYEVTKKTVTQEDRTSAVRSLETMTGLIESVPREDMTDRDRHWLKLATAYQAAFMLDNPDIFSRNDVTSAGQDGESAAFRNVDAHILAPLARKSIRRLSWMQKTRRLDAQRGTGIRNINSEEYDDSLSWRPA